MDRVNLDPVEFRLFGDSRALHKGSKQFSDLLNRHCPVLNGRILPAFLIGRGNGVLHQMWDGHPAESSGELEKDFSIIRMDSFVHQGAGFLQTSGARVRYRASAEAGICYI